MKRPVPLISGEPGWPSRSSARRWRSRGGVVLAIGVLVGGCGSDASDATVPAPTDSIEVGEPSVPPSSDSGDDSSDDTGNDSVQAPAVVTFEVAGVETFKVLLVSDELVERARAQLAGETGTFIPLGRVVRDDPGVNAPWSWHLDPDTIEFAFATTEVCDGIPSFVEDETVTSPDYCPWSAQVVALDAA